MKIRVCSPIVPNILSSPYKKSNFEAQASILWVAKYNVERCVYSVFKVVCVCFKDFLFTTKH